MEGGWVDEENYTLQVLLNRFTSSENQKWWIFPRLKYIYSDLILFCNLLMLCVFYINSSKDKVIASRKKEMRFVRGPVAYGQPKIASTFAPGCSVVLITVKIIKRTHFISEWWIINWIMFKEVIRYLDISIFIVISKKWRWFSLTSFVSKNCVLSKIWYSLMYDKF